MLAALENLRGEFCFTVDVVDVDTDPQALARYDELVPVLAAGDTELCHYFLENAKVREYLTRFG
jgi:thioredoxin reductase (NADPH)